MLPLNLSSKLVFLFSPDRWSYECLKLLFLFPTLHSVPKIAHFHLCFFFCFPMRRFLNYVHPQQDTFQRNNRAILGPESHRHTFLIILLSGRDTTPNSKICSFLISVHFHCTRISADNVQICFSYRVGQTCQWRNLLYIHFFYNNKSYPGLVCFFHDIGGMRRGVWCFFLTPSLYWMDIF